MNLLGCVLLNLLLHLKKKKKKIGMLWKLSHYYCNYMGIIFYSLERFDFTIY